MKRSMPGVTARPSWGWSEMPRARSRAARSWFFPRSKERSEPWTAWPWARTSRARGFMPAPAILEQATARRMAMAPAKWKVVTIPTVVHVVYHTSAENISVAQVKSQIAVLNRDYRKKNPDRTKAPPVWSGLVADVGVKFKLVKITRTHTSRTSFGDDDSVKSAVRGGVSPWPTN